MEYEEFKRQLSKAGLTNKEFAKLLMLNPKSLSNYAGKKKIPSHLAVIAVLMAEMTERRLNFRGVLKKISIDAKKPRGAGGFRAEIFGERMGRSIGRTNKTKKRT